MSNIRQRKIADAIMRELAGVVNREIKDPRKGYITLTHVRVTADLGWAYIYFSVMGEQEKAKDNEAILNRSASFLKGFIAKSLKMRKTPQLKFFLDDTLEYFNGIEKVFNKIHDEDASRANLAKINPEE
jgi:ribosome-binding factor A